MPKTYLEGSRIVDTTNDQLARMHLKRLDNALISPWLKSQMEKFKLVNFFDKRFTTSMENTKPQNIFALGYARSEEQEFNQGDLRSIDAVLYLFPSTQFLYESRHLILTPYNKKAIVGQVGEIPHCFVEVTINTEILTPNDKLSYPDPNSPFTERLFSVGLTESHKWHIAEFTVVINNQGQPEVRFWSGGQYAEYSSDFHKHWAERIKLVKEGKKYVSVYATDKFREEKSVVGDFNLLIPTQSIPQEKDKI